MWSNGAMPPPLPHIAHAFETDRLLIRSPLPGDGAELNAAVLETFENLHLWMPWAKEPPSVEDSERFVLESRLKFLARNDFMLVLFLKDASTLVGCSGLHPKNWDVPSFEIGYWCRARFEGRGYISEAVRAITIYGFEQFGARRIQIRCDARNERSRRVAERCGYRLEGEVRNDDLDNRGGLRSTLLFSMIPEEYALLKR
jgi:RimJ/RimL family protein N-acetyltransferase